MIGSLINTHKTLQRIKTETEASECEAEVVLGQESRQGQQQERAW